MLKRLSLAVFFPFVFTSPSFATEPVKGDSTHVRVWNKFMDDSLALHKKLTSGNEIKVKKTIGGYAQIKDFYTEYRYFKNGQLISQVQWEKDDPEQIHTLEVYVRDDKGRVIRDFTGAYLPHYHNAPTQTLISFHHYAGDLHAFRSFDASGDMTLERCVGKNKKGQSINLILDENDFFNEADRTMDTLEYQECFAGLKQIKLGKYIIPQ